MTYTKPCLEGPSDSQCDRRMRVAIVTDTHLAEHAPAFVANARAAIAWMEAQAPDLIVHLGDITVDGAGRQEEMRFARDVFAGVSAPMHFLPGNHDIGEPLRVTASHSEHPLSAAALAEYREVFGPDYWSVKIQGWQIVGLNSQLFGLGDEREQAQNEWLDDVLASSGAMLGVMLHKPLFRNGSTDDEVHRRYLPVEQRRRLEARLATRDLRFVVSGHTHQNRSISNGAVEHVWAPSSAYFIPDGVQERIGNKIVGSMLLDLDEDAHAFTLAVPDGVAQNDMSDFAELYPEMAKRVAALGQQEAR